MSFIARILAHTLALVWWVLIPVRKRTAIASFRQYFPDHPVEDLREMMKLIILQYFHVLLGIRAKIKLVDPPSAGICICAHGMGWDVSMLTFGPLFPLTVFFKKPTNRIAAWLIERLRKEAQIDGIYKGNSMEAAHKAIESGRLVCFVVDQRYNRGIKSLFFGHPCLSSPAFAALYWKHKTPIFTAWPSYRNQQFHLTFQKIDVPAYSDRESCLMELTQMGQDWVESQIRHKPAHWLWLHKRWKLDKEG